MSGGDLKTTVDLRMGMGIGGQPKWSNLEDIGRLDSEICRLVLTLL